MPGGVHIYSRNGTDDWALVASWAPSGEKMYNFGKKVSISADGNLVAVGAPDSGNAGAVHLLQKSANGWSYIGTRRGTPAVNNAEQGSCVDIAPNGNAMLITGPNSNNQRGEAWVVGSS